MMWLLLASACYAMRRSWEQPGLLLYFSLQVLYTSIGMAVLFLGGETSLTYAWTYSILTALILMACLNIVKKAMLPMPIAIAGIIALALSRAAYLGLNHPARYYDWIGILEAGVLLFCGLLLGASLPNMPRWDIGLVLFCLWMGLAIFRFGFYIHLPASEWIAANWQVPSGLCIAAFSLIGWLSSRPTP